MDFETIFSDSKWKMLTELAHAKVSPTSLAKKTQTTLANVSTQIRLLEALGFVQKTKLSNVSKGEPRKLYSLKKEFGYLVLGTKTVFGKKMFDMDEDDFFFFKVWMVQDKGASQVLIKFYTEYEEIIRKTSSLGYLGIRGDELELLMITDVPESLYYLNEQKFKWKNKEYKIKVHAHNFENFKKGIKINDEYYVTILKKVFILLDDEQKLSKLKINL